MSGAIALPRIAPKARALSRAVIACPGVADVVSRSPGTIGSTLASALHTTVPLMATSSRRPGGSAPRIRPGLRSGALEITPATRRSWLGTTAKGAVLADHHDLAGVGVVRDLEALRAVSAGEQDVARDLYVA